MRTFSKKLEFIARNSYRRSKRALSWSAALIAVIVYLLYHLLNGNRGLFALFEIRKVVSAENSMLSEIESKTAFLARKIRLLHPDSLDIDTLEEQSRTVLNMAHEHEIIVNTEDILARQTVVAKGQGATHK
jgi:cell division protein FtsB